MCCFSDESEAGWCCREVFHICFGEWPYSVNGDRAGLDKEGLRWYPSNTVALMTPNERHGIMVKSSICPLEPHRMADRGWLAQKSLVIE